MRVRDEKKIDTIFNATLKLSGSYGLSGLTMSKIAKEAKIAHGTLYIYFENKEVLLNKLYAYIHEKGTFSMMSSVSHLPIKQLLQKLWGISLKYRVANPYLLIFMEQFVISPYISEEGKKLDRQYYSFFDELLTKGKKEGIIKPMSNQILIALLSGYIREVAQQIAFNNKRLTTKIIEDSFTICWDAISVVPQGQR